MRCACSRSAVTLVMAWNSFYPAFDCSWARPRMWEQYGDNHAGACLLFDRGRFEAILHHRFG